MCAWNVSIEIRLVGNVLHCFWTNVKLLYKLTRPVSIEFRHGYMTRPVKRLTGMVQNNMPNVLVLFLNLKRMLSSEALAKYCPWQFYLPVVCSSFLVVLNFSGMDFRSKSGVFCSSALESDVWNPNSIRLLIHFLETSFASTNISQASLSHGFCLCLRSFSQERAWLALVFQVSYQMPFACIRNVHQFWQSCPSYFCCPSSSTRFWRLMSSTNFKHSSSLFISSYSSIMTFWCSEDPIWAAMYLHSSLIWILLWHSCVLFSI